MYLTSLRLLTLVLLLPLAISCSLIEGDPDEEDGLSPEIRDLVPEYILDGIEDLGQPVHRGDNPPDIAGVFLVHPQMLVGTTVSNDTLPIGYRRVDATLTISNQTEDQRIDVLTNHANGTYTNNTGSLISGDGCSFTVFYGYVSTDTRGHQWTVLSVISGCVSEEGLEDYSVAYVMLDDGGDPYDFLFDIGEGRRFIDDDGLAERQP